MRKASWEIIPDTVVASKSFIQRGFFFIFQYHEKFLPSTYHTTYAYLLVTCLSFTLTFSLPIYCHVVLCQLILKVQGERWNIYFSVDGRGSELCKQIADYLINCKQRLKWIIISCSSKWVQNSISNWDSASPVNNVPSKCTRREITKQPRTMTTLRASPALDR